MLVFRGVQIRKLDRLLKAPDLKVSEVNYMLMVGRWWKSRWLDYFKDPSRLAPAKKNPHHLIGTVFCRSRSQHINNSIYIYIHILYQGDLKNQLENKRRRRFRCSWFIFKLWMISENSGTFSPQIIHFWIIGFFSNQKTHPIWGCCIPYFWNSTQIWMRKLLSRWRRIPPLRRCCAPWSNRRRWSKRNETGGLELAASSSLGQRSLGGGGGFWSLGSAALVEN